MTPPFDDIELSDAQLDRYARHIVLPDVGGEGQRRLLSSSVTMIGAGGLGSPLLLYLAAAGVGHIRLIDDDVVSLSNLQRQVIYDTPSVGEPKVQQAARQIARLNPDCRIDTHQVRLSAKNAADLIGAPDLVIDGSDSFQTRLVVNRQCLAAQVPLLSAALGPFDGQIAVFDPTDLVGGCYQCFVGDSPAGDGGTCAEDGILGAAAGMVGSWAATEALKHLAGIGSSLAGKLLIIDLMQAETRKLSLARDPACSACGGL